MHIDILDIYLCFCGCVYMCVCFHSVCYLVGWCASRGSMFSGTAGSGATIRMYLERHVGASSSPSDISVRSPVGHVLGGLAEAAVSLCRMYELTGMSEPTVIT